MKTQIEKKIATAQNVAKKYFDELEASNSSEEFARFGRGFLRTAVYESIKETFLADRRPGPKMDARPNQCLLKTATLDGVPVIIWYTLRRLGGGYRPPLKVCGLTVHKEYRDDPDEKIDVCLLGEKIIDIEDQKGYGLTIKYRGEDFFECFYDGDLRPLSKVVELACYAIQAEINADDALRS